MAGAKTKEINLLSTSKTTTVTTDIAMLDTLDPASREVAVTSMLDQARQWLERAKESTVPAQDVAEFKAFVATVAEAAKQKKLSEGIQLDAVEMVRRSERALGVAIRQGQEAGEITTNATGPAVREGNLIKNSLPSPSSFFNGAGQATHETYVMTDGISDEQFETALESAKSEGNLSRANVVRKVSEISTYRERQDTKWAKVDDLAARGYTSPQIAAEIDMTEASFRNARNKRSITVPADNVVGKSRRIDPLYVLEQIVLGLEVSQSSLELVSFEDVTPQQADEWLERLTAPMRAIKRMQTTLKEIN